VFRLLAISVISLFALAANHRSAWAKTVIVNPGGSIQSAVDGASSGDTIVVRPGTYQEGAPGDLNAVTVTKPGLELVALSSPGNPVVLEGRDGQSFGFWVTPPDSAGAGPESDPERPPCAASGAQLGGFVLRGFTLRNFARHGAHLACVNDFVLAANDASGNGSYGLFPVHSKGGLLINNVAHDSPNDAAIYVGQSEQIVVEGNAAHDSLIGIEVENSRDCVVSNNDVYANTTGILVDIMPGLPVKTLASTLVASNRVHDNNRPNTTTGDNAALVPGIGILTIGGDLTRLAGNTVTGNQLSGIATISFCTASLLSGASCTGIDVDPNPNGNQINNNTVTGNGSVPFPNPIVDALRADLSWDGSGTGNCWSGDRFGSSVPAPLPACR
jgi:parallel beta-helix repeat protein